jgi:transcriptional regulator with XRE-family HTH domain
MNADWFAARLRQLRERKGWTQQQLADALGKHKSLVSDLEQGRYSPNWTTVVALSQALGVTCMDFLDDPETEAAPMEPAKRPRGRPKQKAPEAIVEAEGGQTGKRTGKRRQGKG